MTIEEKTVLLNDSARLQLTECLIKTSEGVDALNRYDVILREVRRYDFNDHNVPDDAHDFGVIWVEGSAVFWTIECFEHDLKTRAVDPSNIATTARVLSIMLDEEFLQDD